MPNRTERTPLHVIEFGRAEWQSHLGGDFQGPESSGEIFWNWVGAKKCWCILPELDRNIGYEIQLEAAPLAPFDSELRELSLVSGAATVFKRVVPCSSEETKCLIDLPQNLSSPVELRWTKLPPPALHVFAQDTPAAYLEFETRPDLQMRRFLLRRELLTDRTILAFEPNFAIHPATLEKPEDRRVLSFKFFRMTISQSK